MRTAIISITLTLALCVGGPAQAKEDLGDLLNALQAERDADISDRRRDGWAALARAAGGVLPDRKK